MHSKTTTVSCPSTFVRRRTLTALLPACLAAAVALLPWVAEAQDLQPVGSEFQVNTTTILGQYQPSVALDTVGNFVVVWEGNDGSAGYNYDVFGQRYAADGSPRGDEFLVNTFTTDSQFNPSMAGSPSGAFVVVWMSDGDEPGAGGERSAQGQRFDANGNPVASQFQISTYTTSGLLTGTDVAVDATGAFLVVWQSDGSPGADTDFWSIQARAFASDGTPVANQFQVNVDTAGSQLYPAVSVDDDERFVVVWTSFDSPGVPDLSRILARRFDAQGSALGDPFQIDDAATGQKRAPDVAAAPDGSFLVAWSSTESAGDADISIQARRFAADDTPLEDQFQVNTYTTGNQQTPAVSFAADGRFVVAWHSRGSDGGDTNGDSIRARYFAADGQVLGDEFQINTYTPSDQTFPSVASDGQGRFVVAWESYGSPGDESWGSVLAQRLMVPRITGHLWLDADADGVQDGGELGFAGVAVELFDVDGTSRGTTTSADDGSYELPAAQGLYYLAFEEPDGFCYTLQDQGDDTLDSDVDPVTLTTALFEVEIDGGLVDRDGGLQVVPLFTDGFESGDLSAWSAAVP